jgi:hypothetical protein
VLANERTQAKGAADYADLVLGTSAAACANGAQCSAGEMVIAAAAIGILQFDAAEIVAVNKIFNTTGRFGFASPNLITTPHVGYVSRALYRRFYGDMVTAIEAWLGENGF